MLIIKASFIFILHFSSAKEESSLERENSKQEYSLEKEGSLEQEDLLKKAKSLKKDEEVLKKEEPIVNLSPHVIIILADDLGWNDVSFHGSPQIPTPNIDALAANSIILNSYYTELNCASSRASLMSGQYSIHLGLQHSKIKTGEIAGLSLDVKIMPEYFQDKGYSTYMVGKWNLGYFRKEYTPIYRGFDSFFGFYNEQIDYYDFTSYRKFEDSSMMPLYGVDLQDGITPIKNFRGRYATDVFSEKAVSYIENHNESNPLFLYMAHLAPHSGNEYMPLQAPFNQISKNAHIQDTKRRTYAGVVSALDESVGKLIEALNKRGFLENSIILFASDNGGDGKGSNWPLRGQKGGSWEGSIRVPCFLWSPLLNLREPRVSNQLLHVSDWLPTLYEAVGGETSDFTKIDGFSMWKAFIRNLPSPRVEVLHNIDPISKTVALRRGDYKLVNGISSEGRDLWYGAVIPDGINLPSSMDDWVFKNESLAKKILEEANLWIAKAPDSWRNNTSVVCKQPPPLGNAGCEPNKSPCLFNVASDPCEYDNLALQYPRIVRSMMNIIDNYSATAMEPLSNTTDPRVEPRCHGFVYVPWLDEEYNDDCLFY